MEGETRPILISGGAGFVGSHLVDRLVREGRGVWVLDNLSTGSQGNLEPHIRSGSIKLISGDIRDQMLVEELMTKVEAVIHLAAIVDHEACLQNPRLANDVNQNGTLTLLEAARRHELKRFVYASSAAVYGNAQKLPIPEDQEPAPLAPYGASKLAAERYCLQYQQSYGLNTVCLRYFNIFGPRQTAKQYSGVITEFIKRLQRGMPPTIFGDGLQTRDFVSIADVVQATVLALDRGNAVGVYNIAAGKETSIKTLADLLIQISGRSSLAPLFAPERPGEIRRSVASIAKAMSELGFQPGTELGRDLLELWSWCLRPRAV